MSRVFLSTYYMLLFYFVFRKVYAFFNNIPTQIPEYVMFARPLSLFHPPPWIHSIIFLFCLSVCLFCILNPKKYLRIITSFLVLMVFSIFYSYGKINHSHHIWIISSVLMCFLSLEKPLQSQTNQLPLRLAQAILLSHYFIAGLWKIRILFHSKFVFSLKEIVLEHIAMGQTNGFEMNIFINMLLYQYPEFLSFCFFCVLIFQMTALLPVLLGRFFILYGVLAILFHLSSGITLGVYYTPTVVAVLFFLIILEIMLKDENRNFTT